VGVDAGRIRHALRPQAPHPDLPHPPAGGRGGAVTLGQPQRAFDSIIQQPREHPPYRAIRWRDVRLNCQKLH
jgi:hypothetical protein